MKILIVAAVLAEAVLGNSLTSLLQDKLTQSMEMQSRDCSQVEKMFCPINGGAVPNVVFPAQGGQVSGHSQSCCKGNYLQCQLQLETALCRDLAYYTVTAGQGNSETVCPPVPNECTCQQALASETNLQLKLCPNTPECCPSCECHGDPHCLSFDHTKAQAVWAVCDDRDSTCTHKPATCEKTYYAGKQCKWVARAAGYSECVRDDDTPIPMMQMHWKQYKNYWNSNDQALYTFSLNLELTAYGSVSVVTLVDAGQTSVFTINAQGKCVGTPQYPLNANRVVVINDLPSGVWVQLECMNNGPKLPQRWDVRFVRDPWFLLNPLVPTQDRFAGFCTTGVIAENTGETIGGCRIMDRQIAMFYGCNPATAIATCKSQFCNNQGTKFNITSETGTAAKKCTAFVSNPKQPTNFVAAACSLSTSAKRPVNPELCVSNPDCKRCIDSITDFPDQIAEILNTPILVATQAPTQSCPTNLLQTGLSRKKLSVFQSGVQIEYKQANVWTGVFAVLDAEVVACGGCTKVISVNGSVSTNQALLTPGEYRIRQCTGYNNDKAQPLCDGALGYNATVQYSNPTSGGAVSATFGALFDGGDLVCSPTRYPKCPINYQCCHWDKITQALAWEQCMDVTHGGAKLYPNCGLRK